MDVPIIRKAEAYFQGINSWALSLRKSSVQHQDAIDLAREKMFSGKFDILITYRINNALSSSSAPIDMEVCAKEYAYGT